MKKMMVTLGLLLASFSAFADPSVVVHPAPKEPRLIAADLMPGFKTGLAVPPATSSDAQRADEKELRERQAKRTAADCERGKSEVLVSLASFYGKPHGPLTAKEVESYAPFFEQIRNDADFYIQMLKKEFPRPRPFSYMADLEPCVPREVTGAYPSGHATLAKLYALVLSDLFPERKKSFLARAEIIGSDRVMVGMHHPSDVQTGYRLGELVYGKLKESKPYAEALAFAKSRAAGK